LENKVKEIFWGLGADVCGIANVDKFAEAPRGFHPTDVFKDCRSVVVYALALPKGLTKVSPRIVYQHINSISRNQLDYIGIAAGMAIEALGGVAVPLPCDAPYDYWDPEKMEGKGVISMRHAAVLAEVGSMGKNTLVINKRFGSMINIGALLTDLDLKSDPPQEDICLKDCRACLDSCPPKALDGISVNQKLCRENAYSTNARGFEVCECNLCRVKCPLASGVKAG